MSVGAQLQQARTGRKLSLADVTRHTKIQPWVLEALEADRLHEMMSPIYVKGFLSTYAKFLSLDAETLVTQLPLPKPEPEPEPLPPPARPLPSLRMPLPLLRRLGAAAAVCAAVAALVVINPAKQLKKIRVSLPKPKPMHVSLPKVSLPKVSLPKTTTPKLASVTPLREPMTPATLPSVTLSPTQPLELVVDAQRSTWIQVRADGKLLTQQRLSRGAKERWTAKRQLELIVANPSQVDLVLNGQPISAFAIAHHGRLSITHRGIAPLASEE